MVVLVRITVKSGSASYVSLFKREENSSAPFTEGTGNRLFMCLTVNICSNWTLNTRTEVAQIGADEKNKPININQNNYRTESVEPNIYASAKSINCK